MSIFELKNVSYSYDKKKQVVQNCNYTFEKGKVYAIVGRSGSGKTTLLSMLSGLVRPTGGEIQYNGENIGKINSYEYRSKYVGVIFQAYNLLPHLTAKENVMLSMEISGKKIQSKKERAEGLLNDVGIYEELQKRKILKLSGGEQQRIAIARTLAYDPDVILADEPTGNLDQATENTIIEIFKKLAKEQGKCIVLVTHSPAVAKQVDVCYELKAV